MTMGDILYYFLVTLIVVVNLGFLPIFFTHMFTADATKSLSAYVDKHTTKKKGFLDF